MEVKQLDFICIYNYLGTLGLCQHCLGKFYIPESLVFYCNLTVILFDSWLYCWVCLAFPFNLIYHFNGKRRKWPKK